MYTGPWTYQPRMCVYNSCVDASYNKGLPCGRLVGDPAGRKRTVSTSLSRCPPSDLGIYHPLACVFLKHGTYSFQNSFNDSRIHCLVLE